MVPGDGAKPLFGILRVEPRLDRVTERDGRVTNQSTARGDVELQLHQVDARGHLGDRVLDLEPRVDLQEREALLVGLVEELDGARVAVSRGAGKIGGRLPERLVLLRGQQRGCRLLDHLLIATLHAAFAHTQRPDRPVVVGDDLHLDVAGTGDDPFHEHGAVSERQQRLGL